MWSWLDPLNEYRANMSHKNEWSHLAVLLLAVCCHWHRPVVLGSAKSVINDDGITAIVVWCDHNCYCYVATVAEMMVLNILQVRTQKLCPFFLCVSIQSSDKISLLNFPWFWAKMTVITLSMLEPNIVCTLHIVLCSYEDNAIRLIHQSTRLFEF